MILSLKKISKLIDATLIGDSSIEINGISTLKDADENFNQEIEGLEIQCFYYSYKL